MICKICGNKTDVGYGLDGGGFQCARCYFLESPPKAKITLSKHNIGKSPFFCFKSGLMEYVTTLEELSACGWFIRKLSISTTNDKATIHLEYNGNMVCPRVSRSYNRFPLDSKKCTNYLCSKGGQLA
jgi:hypothetical protein